MLEGGKSKEAIGFMNMMEVCKEFGWDYWTYMKQPSWVIESFHNLLEARKQFIDQNGK